MSEAEEAVRVLIRYLGDDPTRPGLVETPARVLRMFDEIREAGKVDNVLTTFESSTAKDLVIVRNIPLYSLCEHHMMPYYGDASVAYIPEGQVLGLSKIARLVDKHASGLTIQEELSSVIAHSVQEAAKCKSVAVVTRATHMCMVMRGVKAHNSSTVASAMLGEFRNNPTLRMEFMSLKEG